MMTDPVKYLLILFILASTACEKTEPELLSGDIAGLVWVYDENYYLQDYKACVQVRLTDGSFDGLTTTDPSGKFLFEEQFYGNYQITLELEGYFSIYQDYPLHHLGGYSPTLVEYAIHEIPKFETYIDSIRYEGTYNRYYLSVNLQGLTGLPKYYYGYWCCFSDTPDVSKDQFVANDVGYILTSDIVSSQAELMVEIWDNRFDQLESDTIYCRVYPRSWGQGLYDYYPESLGKASNIISFVVENSGSS